MSKDKQLARATAPRLARIYTQSELDLIRIEDAALTDVWLTDRVSPFVEAVAMLRERIAQIVTIVGIMSVRPSELRKLLDGTGPMLGQNAINVAEKFKRMRPTEQPDLVLAELRIAVSGLIDRIGDFVATGSAESMQALREYCFSHFGGNTTALYDFIRSSYPHRLPGMTPWRADIGRRGSAYLREHPKARWYQVYKAVLDSYNADEQKGTLSEAGQEARKRMMGWPQRRHNEQIKKVIREYEAECARLEPVTK